MIKFVANHVGDMDESPTLVRIPAGSYNVVLFPQVMDESLCQSIVDPAKGGSLFTGWILEALPATASKDLVPHLPDGEAVGWK